MLKQRILTILVDPGETQENISYARALNSEVRHADFLGLTELILS